MEKEIRIRTADKEIANDIFCYLTKWFDQHINFMFWEGTWELTLEADENDIDSLVEIMEHGSDFAGYRDQITYETRGLERIQLDLSVDVIARLYIQEKNNAREYDCYEAFANYVAGIRALIEDKDWDRVMARVQEINNK